MCILVAVEFACSNILGTTCLLVLQAPDSIRSEEINSMASACREKFLMIHFFIYGRSLDWHSEKEWVLSIC